MEQDADVVSPTAKRPKRREKRPPPREHSPEPLPEKRQRKRKKALEDEDLDYEKSKTSPTSGVPAASPAAGANSASGSAKAEDPHKDVKRRRSRFKNALAKRTLVHTSNLLPEEARAWDNAEEMEDAPAVSSLMSNPAEEARLREALNADDLSSDGELPFAADGAEEELVRRRRQKLSKLLRLYKSQFRRLKELLMIKHKKYLRARLRQVEVRKKVANKPKKELTEVAKKLQDATHDYRPAPEAHALIAEAAEKLAPPPPPQMPAPLRDCAEAGCPAKAMPLTKFCYAHILRDPNQKLFASCAYVNTSGEQCTYPIIVGQNPPVCVPHTDLFTGQKKEPVTKKSKRGPPGSTPSGKPEEAAKPPTRNQLLAEIHALVRGIQLRRKQAQAGADAEVKLVVETPAAQQTAPRPRKSKPTQVDD
jgi:hypothetical protein